MNRFPDAKILEIDLTSGIVKKLSLPSEIYKAYPGGSSLGLYLMLNDKVTCPDVNALSDKNPLIFSVSALTGVPMSGINRMCVTSKSPLTETIGDSQAGGFFPVYLKANGYDAVIVRGKAANPVYIMINGDEVEIKDASAMWGKVTGDAEKLIREDLNDEQFEIAQIGPAGENLVKYACIINMCNRANGRNGMGAVMGSKKLKALVVKRKKPELNLSRDAIAELTALSKKRMAENQTLKALGEYGTDGDLESFNELGYLPTRNWMTGFFGDGAEKITGTTMTDTILKKRDTCYACAIRCKRVVEIPDKVDSLYGGPEYETVASFGSYCGVDNLEIIAQANQLCNMYGIDTISCGATIAFAMECYEKGLITKNDTDGLELKFGNGEAMLKTIYNIATRSGFGNLLAEGSYRAAEHISKDAIPLSISVKKQELPAHMPQFKPAVGIIYAVNPFGADHQSSEHDPFLSLPKSSMERERLKIIGFDKGYKKSEIIDNEKAYFSYITQCYFSMLDTLCLCQFVWGPCWELFGPDDLLKLCQVALGWETSIEELLKIGERRLNMMRYFNAKIGFDRKDDVLPERLFSTMEGGNSEGTQLNKKKFYSAVEKYYECAGWDKETGNPSEEKMKSLGLGWIIDIYGGAK